MINDINEVSFLVDLGVSSKAIELLINNSIAINLIKEDLIKLEEVYKDMPKDICRFPSEFKTYLWTLLGEISIPNSLGEDIPESWPVLVFPFAKDEEHVIKNYLSEHGFFIKKREDIIFNEVLHACLYGGQAWFDSLRYALNTKVSVWGKEAILLWIAKGPEGKCSIASMARKLQLQLRPSMVSYSVKNNQSLYPGVIKAFHTPHLGNVGIHSMILNLEEWKC